MSETETIEILMADLKELAFNMVPPFSSEDAVKLVDRMGAALPSFLRFSDAVLRLAENGTLDRLAVIMEKMSEPGVMDLMEGALDAAAEVDAANPRRLGVTGLLKALRNEEVQKSLGIVTEIARKLPAAMEKRE